jgi:hypothetical protein
MPRSKPWLAIGWPAPESGPRGGEGVQLLITSSVDGVAIRLTGERGEHICRRHPELVNERGKVLETVSNPSEVFRGDFGEKLAVRFYRRTPLTSKYLVVVYREIDPTDGFVVTAYFTRPVAAWRERLWSR